MDTVEIVVYLTVAVIVGGMILAVTQSSANEELFFGIKSLFIPDEEPSFEVVNNESVASYLFQVWDACGLGAKEYNVTFQYTGDPITKSSLFNEVKRLRLCNSFSSFSEDCGVREDVQMPDPLTPSIYVARCDVAAEQLVIE